MATSFSKPLVPRRTEYQSNVADLTPRESEIRAVTVAGVSGAGVLKATPDIDGGSVARKLSLRRPGLPAGFSNAGIAELAQFAGSSDGAKGQIRSNEVEWPSGLVGHGSVSEYFTASIRWPAALLSSIFSPRWLSLPEKSPMA